MNCDSIIVLMVFIDNKKLNNSFRVKMKCWSTDARTFDYES